MVVSRSDQSDTLLQRLRVLNRGCSCRRTYAHAALLRAGCPWRQYTRIEPSPDRPPHAVSLCVVQVMPPTVRAALVPNEWTLEKVQQPDLSVDGGAAGLYVDTIDASDPMERFCADAPDADECRVYED